MKCFQIDLNELPKVALWGKEALIPPRLHYSRYLTEYVMYVVIKGELKLMVNEDVVVLGTGDVYIFCNGDLQESLESSFCEYYYVHFCSESLCETELDEAEYSDLINKKRGLCLTADAFSSRCYEFLDVYVKQKTHIHPGELFDSIKELMQNNILTTESKYPEKRLAVSNALSTVLVKLESSSIGTPKSDKSNTQRGYDTARAIAEYIELHYDKPITGRLIESKFFLTYDYVNSVFNKIMGCTINKYCNIVRIQHAKAKLRATNMTVKEVAMETGFKNEHYFSRLFNKNEGISPSDYKRKFLVKFDKEGQDESNEE